MTTVYVKGEWTPERVTLLLERMGWREVDLAARLRVGQITVHRWILGQTRPLPAFCDQLDALWQESEAETTGTV